MLLMAPLAILGNSGGSWQDITDHPGLLSPAVPVGRWGTLPPSNSDPAGPDGPSVTGGPVGDLGTLSSSTFAPAILVDPGGTLPSFDLAGMLLPAIPVSPVGMTAGLWPGVAVPLPALWDPLFASSLVEELKVTGADVVGRSLAVRGPLPWLTLVLRRIVQSSA